MHLQLSLFPLLTLLLCILTPTQASPHATTIQSDHNNLLNWVQTANNRLGNFDGSISKGFPLLQTAYEMYQLTNNLETHTQNTPAFDDEDSATLYNGTVEFRTAASDLVNRFATKVPHFRNMNALPVARKLLQYVQEKNAATVDKMASKVTEPHREAFKDAAGDIDDYYSAAFRTMDAANGDTSGN
ncbi:hypothetical protein AtubIFM57258_003301 [Aspergillus tubingensis]|nr:hypothetical protein AtubIFM57258_003301 [Aspergillus tubingensis]